MMLNESIVRDAEKQKQDLMPEGLVIKGLFLKEIQDMKELVKVVIGTTLFVLTMSQAYNSHILTKRCT